MTCTKEENNYSATVVYTHGTAHLNGTIIFVLAKIEEEKKNESFLYVDQGERLVNALGVAVEKRDESTI